jgi:hypothetical protein
MRKCGCAGAQLTSGEALELCDYLPVSEEDHLACALYSCIIVEECTTVLQTALCFLVSTVFSIGYFDLFDLSYLTSLCLKLSSSLRFIAFTAIRASSMGC